MKHIVLLILLLFPISTWADTINISTDTTRYHVDDAITLTIQVESQSNTNGQIIISGLEEQFDIVSQTQSQQTKIINGSRQQSHSIIFKLLAHQSWEYTLWPIAVKYDDDTIISSNSINISVTGSALLIKPNTLSRSQNTSSWGRQEPQDLSQIQLPQSQKSNKEILWVDGEIMTDIYDIKANKLPSLLHIWTFIIAVLFGLAAYMYHRITLHQAQHSLPTHSQVMPVRRDYMKQLKEISKNSSQLSSEVFYKQLWDLFRLYLEYELHPWLASKSLKQAQDSLPDRLSGVYQTLYYPAYDSRQDEQKKRDEILTQIKEILSNTP